MTFSTMVGCAQLAEHLGDADWRIFDCRHQLSDVGYGTRAYAEGHLPGAFFMHLDRDLSSPMTGRNGRHPLPDVAALAARFLQGLHHQNSLPQQEALCRYKENRMRG